ncbi:MAG TPA: GNAT family N-acetyltransferase [Acetobacteraceae bacterium]|nr:GNAT family N-acetyltransferase [Acetobacteraceae bacterium]
MTTLAADLITDDAALATLRPSWERLWRRASSATPFQSPAWLLPWWRQFGTGAPRVAILRDGGGLEGILPLYVLQDGAERRLLPMGAGITDYQDALLAPGLPADAARLLLEVALRRARRDGVTVCDLIDLPPDARLREAPNPDGWRGEWRSADPCPVLALPDTVEQLGRRIPATMLRKLRMNRHRVARAGGCAVEIATAETVPVLLDGLFRLHQARWDGEGVLADPRVRAFHREAAPLLLAAGALRLQVLRFGARIVAAYYALLAGPRILFYLSGYDPDHASESPGTVLLGAMIEAAVREGRTELHFLRGGENYKHAWGGVDRVNMACRLVPA